MAMAALTSRGNCFACAPVPHADLQAKRTHKPRNVSARPLVGRLGNAALIFQQLRPPQSLSPRQWASKALRKQPPASPVAAITAVGTGGNGEFEKKLPASEFLDDPEVGQRSETGRYLGRKETPVTVVIDGKLLAEGARKAGEAAKKTFWPPNKNWIPFLVAPAALLLALVAARLHQLKSAAVPPSVTTSIAMPLEPRGPAPELRVVGVLGSLPGMATQAAAVDAHPLGQGSLSRENDGMSSAKQVERRVDGQLARNDNRDPHIPRPQAPAKPIHELSDMDFYDQLQKEAEIEARVRQAQGFPMKDETKFGVFDEEERTVMQELVDSGELDADTQKKLEELLAQEAGNSKMRKAAQRALGKRVRKARAGGRSPVSDKDIKELEEAVASGMLDEKVQKDVEAFLEEEREFQKELEENKYDDADYDISEYLEEEEDPELEALIRQMVESGEFEMPADEDDDEEEAAPFGQGSADVDSDMFDENEMFDDLDEDWTDEHEEPSSSGAATGGSKQGQKGAQATDGGAQKGGGQNRRVTGLRELTDKLGLTMPAGESGRDWEAELRKKNLARIGPFDFANSDKNEADKGPTPQAEAAKPSSSSEAEEALRKIAETTSAEQLGSDGAPFQGKEFPFSEAFQEATEAAWGAEHPEEVRESSGEADAERVEREAGGVAEVQVAAVRRSGTTEDGQERVEEEIVIRVGETEDSGAGSPGDADATIVLSTSQDGTVEDLEEGNTGAGAAPNSDSAAASSPGSPAADERASSSAGAGMTLAGEDVTPLVELLQSREGDEAYAQGTSWGTYDELSPMKRRWQVWADRQSNQVRLGSARVKLIDSRDIKFSAKEPAMEGNRHFVYQVLYNGKRYALKMSKRPQDRGTQHLLVDEATNLAAAQAPNVIALQGVVRDLGSLPIYRLGRVGGPLMTSEQLAQGVKNGTVEELQSAVLPDGSKRLVKAILAEGSGERSPNVYGILMEYAEGSDLQAQMDKAGPGHSVNVDEAWHIFRQLAVGLGEVHAAKLAHNNVDLSNVLLVRDDSQASGVRCCWSGLSLAKKTDNHGNVRLSTEERLARLMRQDDYYQAPELTDESAAVLYNGFKADTYSLGKAFLLLVGDEYEAQASAESEAVRDMDLMFGMTLQPEPEDRATSVEVMEFTRQKELEAIERWREKEDEKLQEMARAGLPKTDEEIVLENMMDEDPNELREVEEAAYAALVEEMRKRQAAALEQSEGQGQGLTGRGKREAGRSASQAASNRTK
ncbi:Protein kinase-like domain containing protein [Klebsormidium nitens]|uniref:Protein kinase-like domain containing protein n=1 Tax=Klebsormidium nitens TaxID=105231 RepID=A0A1Y1I7F3_KLENI|nr:Protein kinase-like domain containing protein [Klebsormidium nitens]|eukprot:GAQ85862.1 Protein kinase-like domain containing protein [Klebsormidium nitens]